MKQPDSSLEKQIKDNALRLSRENGFSQREIQRRRLMIDLLEYFEDNCLYVDHSPGMPGMKDYENGVKFGRAEVERVKKARQV